jgi:hypothetical protein
MPSVDANESEMLFLISSHSVVPVPLFKPVTDRLEAKRLVVLDGQGVWRLTELGGVVLAQSRRLTSHGANRSVHCPLRQPLQSDR